MKKIVAILFAVMSFSVLADTWTDSNTGITWTYTVSNSEASIGGGWSSPAVPTTTTGAITIPSVLGGYSVTSIGDFAFNGCSALISVTIPSNVTSIGDYAFNVCSALTSVTIPSSVPSIGDFAFNGCSALISVTIPSSVTSIGEGVFFHCSALTSINVDSANKHYCSIDGVLYNKGVTELICCPGGIKLTSVTIPSSVTSIGELAFYGCSALTSINVDSANKYYCSIDGVLYNKGVTELICCPGGIKLTSVTIPSSVTSIDHDAFYGCSSLTSVTIPSSVTSIGDDAFYCCSSLASVTIPSSVTSIGSHTFEDCTSLTSATIPSSVTSIGWRAFYGCSVLTSVTIPSSVTSIDDDAFYGCNGLKTVYVSSGDVERMKGLMSDNGVNVNTLEFVEKKVDGGPYTEVVDGIEWTYFINNGEASIYNNSNSAISPSTTGAITIPSRLGNCPVTNIGVWAFGFCVGLTSVAIPPSVRRIENSAFYLCPSITTIMISSGVTDIEDGAFMGCGGMVEYIVDAENTAYKSVNGLLLTKDGTELIAGVNGNVIIPEGVEHIRGSAFASCSGLTSVTMPLSLTSIGDGAFLTCRALTSITIPSRVTSIGKSAFESCIELKEFIVDAENTAYKAENGLLLTKDGTELVAGVNGDVIIPDGVINISDFAFSGRSALTSITMPASLASIGNDVFYGCVGLKEFIVDAGNAKYKAGNGLLLTKDGTELIAGVNGNVIIPNGVMRIREYAFWGYYGLTSVTIPSSVTSIEMMAFSNCSGLKEVVVDCGDVTRIKDLLVEGGILILDVSNITFVERMAEGGPYTEVVDGIEWTYFINNGEASIYNNSNSAISPSTTGAITIPSTLGNCPVMYIGGGAFYNCGGLTSVAIPTSVTGIGDLAFDGCGGLKEIVVNFGVAARIKGLLVESGLDVSNITFVERMAEGGPYTEVVDGIEWTFIVNNGEAAVYNNNFLPVISISTIGAITIPSTLGGCMVTSIGDLAFMNCRGLTSVTIPSSVMSIGINAFVICRELESVTIPTSVISIGESAFDACSKLSTIYVAVGDVTRVKGLYDWAKEIEFVEISPPSIEGDEGAIVTGDSAGGFIIKPGKENKTVEILIPAGVDATTVTVEVSPKVESIKPSGARVKIINGGNDITEFLTLPKVDGNGVIDLTKATVKEEIVKETLDVTKGAEIKLDASSASIKTAATRKGLTYTLREGTTIEAMAPGDSRLGDGQPWAPKISVKGGQSGFYSIKVTK